MAGVDMARAAAHLTGKPCAGRTGFGQKCESGRRRHTWPRDLSRSASHTPPHGCVCVCVCVSCSMSGQHPGGSHRIRGRIASRTRHRHAPELRGVLRGVRHVGRRDRAAPPLIGVVHVCLGPGARRPSMQPRCFCPATPRFCGGPAQSASPLVSFGPKPCCSSSALKREPCRMQ